MPLESVIITGDARQIELAQFPYRYGVIVADPPLALSGGKGSGNGKRSI
jgi:hypothetical protein